MAQRVSGQKASWRWKTTHYGPVHPPTCVSEIKRNMKKKGRYFLWIVCRPWPCPIRHLFKQLKNKENKKYWNMINNEAHPSDFTQQASLHGVTFKLLSCKKSSFLLWIVKYSTTQNDAPWFLGHQELEGEKTCVPPGRNLSDGFLPCDRGYFLFQCVFLSMVGESTVEDNP